MAPMTPRLRILSVGGNAVSAFLSWRLQATNACDVTLVWKSNFETVSQYGIAFQSARYGNQRFKPRHVVPTVEKAAEKREGAFDYVILCVKALPDVYDLASVIDSVVTPQHTCILLNTTNSIGLESAIEERFPTNVVLSLVCGAELSQLTSDTFEHKGETPEVWVGPATSNSNIPSSIQEDMAQALAMTLSTGEVDCKVSSNIRQQQFERVIGPIAFHPLTVLFETASYSALVQKVGVQQMVSDIIDEMVALGAAKGCAFPSDLKQKIIDKFTATTTENMMWQDFSLGRPMEVETYLGSPLRLSKETGVKVPRIETLYALLHHVNQSNRGKGPRIENKGQVPSDSPNGTPSPHPRMSSQGPPRPMTNGMNGMGPSGMGPNGMPPRAGRPRGSSNMGPPGPRRPPVSMHGGPANGYGRPPMGNGSRQPSRRGSMEDNDLGEFSHLVLYDDIPEGGEPELTKMVALKEREMQLRERELRLREQEARSYRGAPPNGPGPRRGPPPPSMRGGMYDDFEDDDDDWYEPAPTPTTMVDDNFDMMSVTSRKNRKVPSNNAAQFRRNAEHDSMPSRGSRFRPSFGRHRSSQIVAAAPAPHENILEDALIGYSSNRYGSVDRAMIHAESRANSLTASHLGDVPPFNGGGPHMGPNGMNGYPRRSSQSPAHPYNPSMRGGGNGRPSPPNGYPGPHMNGGRPSPPDGVRQPVPHYPPGHNNAVAPQRVEQHAGVSALNPPKQRNNRSLTGSASASAGSGDSAHLDSEQSAHSSQSSLGPRPPIGVR